MVLTQILIGKWATICWFVGGAWLWRKSMYGKWEVDSTTNNKWHKPRQTTLYEAVGVVWNQAVQTSKPSKCRVCKSTAEGSERQPEGSRALLSRSTSTWAGYWHQDDRSCLDDLKYEAGILRTMQSLLLSTLLYRKICRTRNNEIMTKDLSTLLLCLSFLGICHVWFSLPQCWPVRPKVFLRTCDVGLYSEFVFLHTFALNDRLCCEWCRCIGMMLKSFYRMFWKIMALSERAATVTALRHCFCRHSFFWDSWPWKGSSKSPSRLGNLRLMEWLGARCWKVCQLFKSSPEFAVNTVYSSI